MIQRIQSIYLFLTALLAALLISLNPNLWRAKLTNDTYSYLTGQGDFRYFLLTMIIGLLALVCIFLFKKRKLQFRLTVINFLLSIGLIFLQYFLVKELSAQLSDSGSLLSSTYLPAAFLPIPIVILLFLAARGIHKDEKLVRSADRFR